MLGKSKDYSINFFKGEPEPKKPKKGVPPVSEKRKEINKDYERVVRLWRMQRMQIDKFQCEFVRDGERCKKKAHRSPHHKKRRGKFLLDNSTFLAVCMEHHDWIEQNGKEAEKLGYLIREYK